MTKSKIEKTLGEQIVEAMKEAVENPKSMTVYRRGIDVKSIRKTLKMKQNEFAKTYGFNLETLRKWEQGAHAPDQAVTSYLSCIVLRPKLIATLLSKRTSEAV
jgi:putative transcriptional regulator